MNYIDRLIWENASRVDFQISPFTQAQPDAVKVSDAPLIVVPAIKIEGSRCETRRELFDEWAIKCCFADYFGKNWAAFTDCMFDLHVALGFRTNHVLIVIAEPEKILRRSCEDERSVFWEILVDLKHRWADTSQSKRPFQLDLMYVLQLSEHADSAVLISFLERLGFTIGSGVMDPEKFAFVNPIRP